MLLCGLRVALNADVTTRSELRPPSLCSGDIFADGIATCSLYDAFHQGRTLTQLLCSVLRMKLKSSNNSCNTGHAGAV